MHLLIYPGKRATPPTPPGALTYIYISSNWNPTLWEIAFLSAEEGENGQETTGGVTPAPLGVLVCLGVETEILCPLNMRVKTSGKHCPPPVNVIKM